MSVEQRLSVIETDISHLTKNIDLLVSKLPDFYKIEEKQIDLEKRILSLENKNNKKDLLVWSAIIGANIALTIKIVFL